ncbi:MAG TPA: hypothetical protein PLY94_07630 [Gemmatimonadaceae bacterium]|jgi:hypothetical protein|nr:hypothetical protein [Gemmatimonadaceae bacterium]
MHTPTSTSAVAQPVGLSWRAVLLWTGFAATLVIGLLLALRFGHTVPTLVEGFPR